MMSNIQTHAIIDLIHVHEDDWEMRSLYPIGAEAEVTSELSNALEACENNRASDGVGWTDIHLISAPSITYADIGLEIQSVIQALAPHMPRVQRFYATASAGFNLDHRDPYGSYDDSPICFGFDAECFIKIEREAERVTAIWFEAGTNDENHRTGLQAALTALNALLPCVIADYILGVGGCVSDKNFLDAYFSKETAS